MLVDASCSAYCFHYFFLCINSKNPHYKFDTNLPRLLINYFCEHCKQYIAHMSDFDQILLNPKSTCFALTHLYPNIFLWLFCTALHTRFYGELFLWLLTTHREVWGREELLLQIGYRKRGGDNIQITLFLWGF